MLVKLVDEETGLIQKFHIMGSRNSEDVENFPDAVARRDTIMLTDSEREKKRRRLAVYQILEKPTTFTQLAYNFIIFFFVLVSVLLGAVADASRDNKMFYNINFITEVILAIYFISEFSVRMWAIGADVKYRGVWGFLRYARRPVCMVDILIIFVTFALLFIDREKNRGTLLDIFRLVQILRLFHVDRQMSTWTLIYRMLQRSHSQLTAIYYICGIVFVAMSLTLFEVETYFHYRHLGGNDTIDASNPTFTNYGDAMWYSLVSVLTIGYGDIVPKEGISKVITAVMGFLLICIWQAASSLVSMGMTMMMDEDHKSQMSARVKNAAAEVIQHWYRYHLATHRKETWNTIPYFKHVCVKLYAADERIKKTRELEEQLREKMMRKKQKKEETKPGGRLRNFFSQLTFEDHGWNFNPGKRDSILKPFIRTESLNYVHKNLSEQGLDVMAQKCKPKKEVTIIDPKSPKLNKHNSGSTSSLDSSFDLSDVEKEVNVKMYYDLPYMNQRRSSTDIHTIGEECLQRYRPLIRFFNYLLFNRCMLKFRRLRKPYQLLDAEAELCEMEHNRSQMFHELELRLAATVGKAAQSPFSPVKDKLSIEQRLVATEQAVEKINAKQQESLRLIEAIAEALGINEATLATAIECPSVDRRRKFSRQQTLPEVM
ncbi:unnamed protein product, partial [Mesorhabditis spiculigera]